MKILIAASEVAPIVKIGGLADVVGSLPKALEKIGVDADVIIPYFPSANLSTFRVFKSIDIQVPFAESSVAVSVYKTRLPNSNVDVFLLKNDHYFGSGGKQAFLNTVSETETFTFFAKAVVEYIKTALNTYDLVHCNDWHTGLITHLLEDELGLERPATLFTVHNLLYQGIGGEEIIKDAGITPGEHPTVDWNISEGNINLMLQGLASSDYINTVSPTYASEIKQLNTGSKVSDVLVSKENRLDGILNGIDTTQFPRYYDVSNYKTGKNSDKEKLLNLLGLENNLTKPIFSFVSRLDPNQKGLDILIKTIPEIVKNGGQFVLLGVGDHDWEQKFVDLGMKDNVSINIAFSADKANSIYSGSDFLIIPSKYEPCGLTQMIAMWYGTLPVVHAVGGLKDSVNDGVNGFCFADYSSGRLLDSILRAFKIYHNFSSMDTMIKNAMKTDFTWEKSALKYKNLYEKVIALRA